MIAAVQLERRVTGACVFCIFISKLGHQQEPSLVILLEVDKALEIRLHGAVLPLGLPVCLRMKGGRKPSLDVEEVTEQWPEFQGKQGASISDD